jgi:hypothetical protein
LSPRGRHPRSWRKGRRRRKRPPPRRTRRRRSTVQFNRALRDIAKAQSDNFPETLGDLFQFGDIHAGVDLDVAEGIEEFDGQPEFFLEKLRSVGHRAAAAGEENADRRAASLLGAVKLDGLVDLQVEAGEDVAGDLGDGGLPGVLGLLVGATEAHETVGNLELFRIVEAKLGLGGELLGDRVGPEIDAAAVVLVGLENRDVARFRPDVDEERNALLISVVVAKGVGERAGRGVDHRHLQAGRFPRREKLFNDLGLDGDEENLDFAAGCGAEDLVIPRRFGEREGNVLLRLVLDDLGDLGGVDRRQLDELGKDLKPGGREISLAAEEPAFGENFAERLFHRGLARGVLGAREPERLDGKPKQPQAALRRCGKLGDLEASRPEVDAQE